MPLAGMPADDHRYAMQALPILISTDEGHNNGSAFILMYNDGTWLCTAGHLPLLVRQPHKEWHKWPKSLLIPGATLPLFTKGPEIIPRFAYLDAGTHIADLLLLPLTADIAAKPELTPYTRFDFSHESSVHVGLPVTAFGYVRVGSTLSDEQKLEGMVSDLSPELVRFVAQPPAGFSGGPVVNSAGGLVGMNIGHEDGKAVAVSLAALRKAILQFS
jgi:hypothetical protein